MKLAESLNHPHGYCVKIPIENSEDFLPINSFVCVKWLEAGEEPSSWYRAHINQHFHDKSCRIVYDDCSSCEVSEVVALYEELVLKEQGKSYPWMENLSLPKSAGNYH